MRASLALLFFAALAGCGGGNPQENEGQSSAVEITDGAGCSALSSPILMPKAGRLLEVSITNNSPDRRYYTLSGFIDYVAVAGGIQGVYGGSSSVVLTDGQSPVSVADIRAEPNQASDGRQDFTVVVAVNGGETSRWMLSHAPLPAPYSWASMRFSAAKLCASDSAVKAVVMPVCDATLNPPSCR